MLPENSALSEKYVSGSGSGYNPVKAILMKLPGIRFGDPKYTTLVDNGDPSNRLDVTILGDGYTQAEQEQFNQDAQEVVDAFGRIEPMRTYLPHFNFHRVNIISEESGTIDPHVSPRQRPNTALKTFFSPIARRRLVGPDPWVMLAAKASGVPWDKLLVIVNAPRRGAATLISMTVAYASRNSSDFPEIMIHEAGHTIARLMDEYEGDLPDIDFAENWSLPNFLPWPNVDSNWKRPKWWRWLTPGVTRPTPDTPDNEPVVGAFQGAVYTGKGVYRPQRSCLMRHHRDPFCVVCSEQWLKAIYKQTKIADGFLPVFQERDPPLVLPGDQPVTFKAQVIRSERIRAIWRTKKLEHKRWRRRQMSQDYRDFTMLLPPDEQHGIRIPTVWLVEVWLDDISTRIRTPSIKRLTCQKHRWTVITR